MEVLQIKRNTTAVLPIRIEEVNYEQLTKVIFGFKSCLHNDAPLLLKKIIIKNENLNSFEEDGDDFIVFVELSPKETFEFNTGDLFVDVYPVLSSGEVINTGTPIRYEVINTVLNEVIK